MRNIRNLFWEVIMIQLLCQMENFYRSKNVEVKMNEEGTTLSLWPQIIVDERMEKVELRVMVDERDFRKYYYMCPSLGHLDKVTKAAIERLRHFNEKTSRIKLHLDENQDYLLLFDRTFRDLDYFHVDITILDESIKSVVTLQNFVEHNYQEIISIINSNIVR